LAWVLLYPRVDGWRVAGIICPIRFRTLEGALGLPDEVIRLLRLVSIEEVALEDLVL
jgi:hypothetical protein